MAVSESATKCGPDFIGAVCVLLHKVPVCSMSTAYALMRPYIWTSRMRMCVNKMEARSQRLCLRLQLPVRDSPAVPSLALIMSNPTHVTSAFAILLIDFCPNFQTDLLPGCVGRCTVLAQSSCNFWSLRSWRFLGPKCANQPWAGFCRRQAGSRWHAIKSGFYSAATNFVFKTCPYHCCQGLRWISRQTKVSNNLQQYAFNGTESQIFFGEVWKDNMTGAIVMDDTCKEQFAGYSPRLSCRKSHNNCETTFLDDSLLRRATIPFYVIDEIGCRPSLQSSLSDWGDFTRAKKTWLGLIRIF